MFRWQPYSLLTCHITTAGCVAYRSAIAVTSSAARRRYTGDDGANCWRLPGQYVAPSSSCGSSSGYAALAHGGGEAVAVARSTAMPPSCSRSITRSSQPKSNSPSRGWMRDQAKMPRLTMVTPASRMRATSSGQSSSGHCSGL